MQINIFTIPVFDGDIQMSVLNKFLGAHKIITVEQQFLNYGEKSCWSFCVKYIAGGIPQIGNGKTEKVDYKTVLPEEVFAVFSELRTIRKELAVEDAVPAYAVFTDEELAKISQLENITPEHLKQIHGIGAKKIEKYGNKLVELYEKTRISH